LFEAGKYSAAFDMNTGWKTSLHRFLRSTTGKKPLSIAGTELADSKPCLDGPQVKNIPSRHSAEAEMTTSSRHRTSRHLTGTRLKMLI
jgi:hypothetical protein